MARDGIASAALTGALPAVPQSGLNGQAHEGHTISSIRASRSPPLRIETLSALHVTKVGKQSGTKVERIEQELTELQHGLEADQGATGRFVDSTVFKTTVCAMVAVNAVQMGMQADYPDWRDLWTGLDHVFTAGFLCEMVLKIVALGVRKYASDRWNLLDAFLVGIAILDTWVLRLIFTDSMDLQSMSILRIFRVLRLARAIRLVKCCSKLVLVMYGVVDALQAAFCVGMVLFLAIYVAAVFCVGLFQGDRSETYPGYTKDVAEISQMDIVQDFNPYASFGSMSRAMLTLFNISLLAEWTEIVTPVMLKEPVLVLFFLFFVIGMNFAVMNVIIGIIVQTVMEHAKKTEEMEIALEFERQLEVLKQIQSVVMHVDIDGDGVVSFSEMERAINSPDAELITLLRSGEMDLPHAFSADELLCMLDHNGDATITIDEFAGNFYRLLSSNPFQQRCMVQTSINSLKRIVMEHRLDTHKQLDRIELSLRELSCAASQTAAQDDIQCSLRSELNFQGPRPLQSSCCKETFGDFGFRGEAAGEAGRHAGEAAQAKSWADDQRSKRAVSATAQGCRAKAGASWAPDVSALGSEVPHGSEILCELELVLQETEAKLSQVLASSFEAAQRLVHDVTPCAAYDACSGEGKPSQLGDGSPCAFVGTSVVPRSDVFVDAMSETDVLQDRAAIGGEPVLPGASSVVWPPAAVGRGKGRMMPRKNLQL